MKNATLVLGKAPGMTATSFRRRRAVSSANLRLPSLALEVGAFDNPTLFRTDGFAVHYADHFSTEELRTKAAKNKKRKVERTVEVDHVITGPVLSPFIPDGIDLMVANHVIEHLCNPIAWLRDAAKRCSDDAAIFLAVPDQRFTFDYYKQPSDMTSLVRAYDEGKIQPDAYDVARMRYLHTRVDAKALWAGEPPPEKPDADMASSYREQMNRALAETAAGYQDVHCHFYTSGSFMHIFNELFRNGYIPWKAELLNDVIRDGTEFHVLLRHVKREPLPAT